MCHVRIKTVTNAPMMGTEQDGRFEWHVICIRRP